MNYKTSHLQASHIPHIWRGAGGWTDRQKGVFQYPPSTLVDKNIYKNLPTSGMFTGAYGLSGSLIESSG